MAARAAVGSNGSRFATERGGTCRGRGEGGEEEGRPEAHGLTPVATYADPFGADGNGPGNLSPAP